jgi:hypothetical protein
VTSYPLKAFQTNSENTVKKYKDTDEWGKKYDKTEEMQTDLHDAFKQIFDERPRDKNVSIENFQKEIANHPETMGKKLTESERQGNQS